MVYHLVRFTDPLKAEVTFHESEVNLDQEQLVVPSKDFTWDLSKECLTEVFSQIQQIDGTMERRFKQKGSFVWRVNLNHYPFVKNRFPTLLPQIIKSRKLEATLFPFQKYGREWLTKSPERILADDMGLGKTVQAISAIEELIFKMGTLAFFRRVKEQRTY